MVGLPGIDIDKQLDRSKNFQAMKNDLSEIRKALQTLLEIEQNRENQERWK